MRRFRYHQLQQLQHPLFVKDFGKLEGRGEEGMRNLETENERVFITTSAYAFDAIWANDRVSPEVRRKFHDILECQFSTC